MNNIAVSVIIPVYNAEPYLRQCLDSVVNQTLRDIEIICIDDGSTDGSLPILREYERRDSRLRVLTQPNINAGAARNRGLDAASGRYLSFLDADDFFEPEMLEHAYSHAVREQAQLLVFRCNNYITEEDRYTDRASSIEAAMLPDHQPFAGTEMKGNLFLAFVGWAWDKLFLREYLLETGLRFQEQRTTNDLFFTYFALARAKRIVTMDDLFAHHRACVHSSLEATREKSWACFFQALKALRDGLRREGLFDRFERDFVNYCVSFSLWNLFTLPWPSQEVVFYLLKHAWLQELGVTGHDESYFDNSGQYREICQVQQEEYLDMFPEGGLGRYRAEIAALQKEATSLRSDIASLQSDIDWQRTETDAIRASASYKIGRFFTFVPRKLRDFFRRLKENSR